MLWASVAGVGGGAVPATAPSPDGGPRALSCPLPGTPGGQALFRVVHPGRVCRDVPGAALAPSPARTSHRLPLLRVKAWSRTRIPQVGGGGAVGAAPELSLARWRGHLDAPSSPPGDSGRRCCQTSLALPEALFWLLGVPAAPSRSGSGQTRLVRPTAPHTEAGQRTPWGAALERTPGWSRRPSRFLWSHPQRPCGHVKVCKGGPAESRSDSGTRHTCG